MYFFFFNDTATTEIYTLSLHDALPILTEAGFELPAELPRGAYVGEVTITNCLPLADCQSRWASGPWCFTLEDPVAYATPDRKSTRLNSSHANISYAVFCLKKKKNT